MPALEKNASIGPSLRLGPLDQREHVLSLPTSASTARPPISSAVSRSLEVHVRDRDLGVLVGEAQRAGAADPARPARDHDVPARQLHGAGPYSPGMETREIRLARRPHGEPVDEDFELAARELGGRARASCSSATAS